MMVKLYKNLILFEIFEIIGRLKTCYKNKIGKQKKKKKIVCVILSQRIDLSKIMVNKS